METLIGFAGRGEMPPFASIRLSSGGAPSEPTQTERDPMRKASRNQHDGRLGLFGFLGFLGFLGFQFPAFFVFFAFFLFFGNFLKGRRG